MTVAQLIRELQRYPSELTVETPDGLDVFVDSYRVTDRDRRDIGDRIVIITDIQPPFDKGA